MKLLIDILLRLVSHFPKFISFWLYSPKRTKKHVEVSVSAQEGSVEIWCDKCQSKLKVILDFRNNNPFPIEIDRMEVSGNISSASMKAMELFGAKIKPDNKHNFIIEGTIDPANLEKINKIPNDETLHLEVKAIIINEHYNIRDFRHHFDRLMCKYYNKQK